MLEWQECCQVYGCANEVEYDHPAKLCQRHWEMWMHGVFDDSDRCLRAVLSGVNVPPMWELSD
jgi:hypothetical protein